MKSAKNDFFIDFLLQKKYRVLRHLVILVFLFALIITHKSPHADELVNPGLDYVLLSFAYLVLVGMFYANMYVLLPRLLYKKHYIFYLLALLLTVIAGFAVIRLFAEIFILPNETVVQDRSGFLKEFFNVGISLMPFILASTALKLFQRWIIDTERINELENKAFKSELQALKNQINPHFLFNMLNNLNVLIQKDQEKASYVTLKLSHFLRHHLYRNDNGKVSLASEIEFIDDFLALEEIRRDAFSFDLQTDLTDSGLQVPSHIFSIFVENAVKHSLDPDAPSTLEIKFKQVEKTLVFICINTKAPTENEDRKNGVGLKNVKRRLELLYKNAYTLDIYAYQTQFFVNLKLPL